MFDAIIVTLIAIFGRLDSRILGRLNFERPLICCTLVGIALGDLQTGLQVGAMMEMASMGMMSIGASGYDMNTGSIVGCAIVIQTGAEIETALAIAVPMTTLTNLIGTVGATVRIWLTHMCDKYVDEGNFRGAKLANMAGGLSTYIVATGVPVFITVYFGSSLVESIIDYIPTFITNGLSLGASLMAFYGYAMLMSTMLNASNVVFFFLAFLLAGYLGLDLTATALIGICIGLVLYGVKYSGGGIATASASSNDIDDLEDLDN